MAGNEILAVGDEAQAEYEAKEPVVTEEPAPVKEGNEPLDAPVEPEAAAPEVVADKPEEEEAGKFYWGDVPVDIEVPQELASALAEHKIDADKLVAELFSKDGKFELSPESRKPLDKAFGKHIVDGYLNLYKQQNQMFLDKHTADQEAMTKTVQANSTDFDSLVGGDEGWTELAQWATDNLSEADIANVNAVMSLPVEHYNAQRTVIEALKIKQQQESVAANGDPAVKLLSDDGGASLGASDAVPSVLSREAFQELYGSERYKSDAKYAQAVDAARRKGQEAEKATRR